MQSEKEGKRVNREKKTTMANLQLICMTTSTPSGFGQQKNDFFLYGNEKLEVKYSKCLKFELRQISDTK